MHSHPDYFAYFLAAGKVRFTTPSADTQEIDVPANAGMWRGAEEHATENISGTLVRALFSSRSRALPPLVRPRGTYGTATEGIPLTADT